VQTYHSILFLKAEEVKKLRFNMKRLLDLFVGAIEKDIEKLLALGGHDLYPDNDKAQEVQEAGHLRDEFERLLYEIFEKT